MRIAITGSFGWADIGDEAMLTEDLRYLCDEVGLSRNDILLIGGNPDYLARYHEHPRENCFGSSQVLAPPQEKLPEFRGYSDLIRRKAKQSLKIALAQSNSQKEAVPHDPGLEILKGCTAALVTGGGTVNTRDQSGSSVTQMHRHISLFQRAGLPVFMSGQTIGPFGLHQQHDTLGKEVVEMVDVLTTRDSLYSKRYLDLIGAEPKEHIETFDDAYTLAWEDVELPDDTAAFLDSGPAVVLNITLYTGDTPEKRAFMARLIEHVTDQLDLNVVLLSHAPWDYPHLHIVRDQVANHAKARVHLPDTREWRDRQLKKVIASCRAAVGGRYHFIVFAGTSDTPFVGMAGNHYSYIKQDGFARPLGLTNFILNERETWDFDTVTTRLGQALDSELDLSSRFTFPSVSMQRFGQWLEEVHQPARV